MPKQAELELKKNEHVWPINFRLQAEERQVGRWTTYAWTIEDICLYEEDLISAVEVATIGAGNYMMPLELFRDELAWSIDLILIRKARIYSLFVLKKMSN